MLIDLPYLLALFFSWVVSASVLELTDWLSEFLLLSPNFLSLFKRLSVSLSPYLLLITGAGAGSPTLDLKAPVPRLKEKTAQVKQTVCSLQGQLLRAHGHLKSTYVTHGWGPDHHRESAGSRTRRRIKNAYKINPLDSK